MDTDQTEMERIRKKRLELLFNDPNIKIEDIVVAVGDKEIEEEIKNLTELKNKMEDEVQQYRTMKEMTEEVEKVPSSPRFASLIVAERNTCFKVVAAHPADSVGRTPSRGSTRTEPSTKVL